MDKKKVFIMLSTIAVVGVALFASSKLFGESEPNAKQSITDEISVSKKDKKQTDDKKTEEKKTEQKTEQKTDSKEPENKEDRQIKEKTDNKDVEDKTTEEKKDLTKQVSVFDDEYQVKKGDTIFSIARTYLGDVDLANAVALIKQINHIDKNDNIVGGDKLLIPTSENFEVAKADIEGKGTAYTVKSGDTLSGIVEKNMDWCSYKEGLQMIMENNSIDEPENLKADQTIYIPQEK